MEKGQARLKSDVANAQFWMTIMWKSDQHNRSNIIKWCIEGTGRSKQQVTKKKAKPSHELQHCLRTFHCKQGVHRWSQPGVRDKTRSQRFENRYKASAGLLQCWMSIFSAHSRSLSERVELIAASATPTGKWQHVFRQGHTLLIFEYAYTNDDTTRETCWLRDDELDVYAFVCNVISVQ